MLALRTAALHNCGRASHRTRDTSQHGGAWGDWTRLWADHPMAQAAAAARRVGLSQRAGHSGTPVRRFRDRYAQVLRSAGEDCLVFFPVGRFTEFYGCAKILLAERALGLRRIHLPRAGYGFTAGFPAWLGSSFAQRALRQGYAVVVPIP